MDVTYKFGSPAWQRAAGSCTSPKKAAASRANAVKALAARLAKQAVRRKEREREAKVINREARRLAKCWGV